jgi:methionyl-tRNA formyltransferase
MKIIFFGTPPFAAEVLRSLLEKGICVSAVVTRPDKPKGRSGQLVPSAVKLMAQEWNLPLLQPNKISSPEGTEALSKFSADLFIVVAYGEILKQHILDMPKLSCVNLHASLLPKYRGAAPIQQAIIDGQTTSGVSIMHMVQKMDAGDVIEKVEVPIGPDETYGELQQKLCDVGSFALFDVIQRFEEGTVWATSQDETEVSFAPKIELENCEINWDLPAEKIHNLIRGTNPRPGSFCWVDVRGKKFRLKIWRSRVVDGNGTAGTILTSGKEGVVVATANGALLLESVQLEGKKAMSSAELFRGTHFQIFTKS